MNVMFRNVAKASLAIALAAGFAACSDDDENIGLDNGNNIAPAESVFKNGVPASVGNALISLNEKGQVAQIKSKSETVMFEYGSFSRANTYGVIMKVREVYDPNYGSDFYLKLNNQGFISYAYQEEYDNGEVEFEGEWWFEYNKDGQMTKFKHNDDGYNETYTLSYSNGDVTRINYIDEDAETAETIIEYTNDICPLPIANKGCIMLFEDALGLDIDEMGIAYYAGLLGKATKNLPMRKTETEVSHGYEFTEVTILNWAFNDAGLPISFWYDENEYSRINFSW